MGIVWSMSVWLDVVNMEDCNLFIIANIVSIASFVSLTKCGKYGRLHNLAAHTSLQMIKFLTGVTCGLTIDVNTRCINEPLL